MLRRALHQLHPLPWNPASLAHSCEHASPAGYASDLIVIVEATQGADSLAVLSFMSQWGSGGSPRAGTPARDAPSPPKTQVNTQITPTASSHNLDNFVKSSPTQQQRNRSDSRPSSRPISMVQTYQPPLMEVAEDTLPELQPIFTFLNSHSNKLYQEGYFLKLHDLDARTCRSRSRKAVRAN